MVKIMNIALIGYGKMGHAIERILIERGHNVSLIIDVDNACDICADKMRGIDVAIEFSTPDTAFDNVVKSMRAGVPVVCGTTAWLDRFDKAVQVCRECGSALFYASNYSIGVNLFFRINRMLARMMNAYPQYDVTIEEVHHTAKKDSPSGTAVTLAEGVLESVDRKSSWVGHTTTAPDELEVIGIRRSIVPGTHTVTWESPVDSIRMEHMAKGREGFALGAVLAAEFLAGKKGVFGMDDLMVF